MITAGRILCVCVCAICWSCNGRTGAQGNAEKRQPLRKSQLSIVSPKNNERAALGNVLSLSATFKKEDLAVDSLCWFVDGKHLAASHTANDGVWNTALQTTGTHRIEAVAHYTDGSRDIAAANVLLLAAQPPKRYVYRVVKTYPHDIHAYTQGLLYHSGFLYESTGLKGESTLRKVQIDTGEPLQTLNMPKEMFGEGLALAGDELVQITWQNQTAFFYNRDDFALLRKIPYPMREGWGLTFDGTHLLMTDGSATLYFMDKDRFTEVRRLEVCNHAEPVAMLNELEYINGELWANVYQRDEIVRIDPKTGVVTGVINMKGLLNANDIRRETDVLNGIAFDKTTGKIYVTGKKWPKLFEIEVRETP
ncbi:MAG: glutaminyl-peptide cyclotransferase [Bacteroidales bacterium]|nr:glutaminyl-peptide cyclotransferase [Bacteroidales bacterium]